MNEIGVNQKFNENEKEKFALKNFSLSKNRLGIVTNAKKFSLENFGFSGKNNKIYAFLCLLVTP